MSDYADVLYLAGKIQEPTEATLPQHVSGKLRLLEIYKCLQGEGILTGSPSVLIRFAGCSVSCHWSTPGTERVLMADGTMRPAAEIVKGMLIASYAAKSEGVKATLVTDVVAHNSPVIQITTDSGRTLKCTPEHKLHVYNPASASKMSFRDASKCLGYWVRVVDSFREEHEFFSDDYKLGYLQGAYVGDGSSWHKPNTDIVHMRWGVCDLDFITRIADFWNSYGYNISITNTGITPASNLVPNGGTKDTYKISTSVTPSHPLYAVLGAPENLEQARGFVAGFFDAEGEHVRGRKGFNNQIILYQKDIKTLTRVQNMLEDFDFTTHIEEVDNESVTCGRLHVNGGKPEMHRFFRTFSPAIARKYPDFSNYKQLHKEQICKIEELSEQAVYSIMTGQGNYFVQGILSDNCDTKFSWAGNNNRNLRSPESIVQEVIELTRFGTINDIIISGGEPIEQPQEELAALIEALTLQGMRITIETSGVVLPSARLLSIPDILWSIAPKLKSAKTNYETTNIDLWILLQELYGLYIQFKFVVAPETEEFKADCDQLYEMFSNLSDESTTGGSIVVILQACTPYSHSLEDDKALLIKRVQMLEQMVLEEVPAAFIRAITNKNLPLYVRYQNHFVIHGHRRGV